MKYRITINQLKARRNALMLEWLATCEEARQIKQELNEVNDELYELEMMGEPDAPTADQETDELSK